MHIDCVSAGSDYRLTKALPEAISRVRASDSRQGYRADFR